MHVPCTWAPDLANPMPPPSFQPPKQVMLADRDFMQTQLQASDEHNGKLAFALERMRRRLAQSRGVDPGACGGVCVLVCCLEAGGLASLMPAGPAPA